MTNIRRGHCLLAALILCHFGTSSTFAQIDGVTLSSRLGFDNKTRPDCWTPVFLTIENRGERVAGEIVVATYRDEKSPLARITKRVTLEKPSRKRFTLYVMMSDAVTEVRVQLHTNRRMIERVLIPQLLATNDEVELAVYDSSADEVPRSMDLVKDGKHQHRLVVAPEWLPDRWFGYDAVSMVAFNDVNPNHLNPEQIVALKQCVAAGGKLTVDDSPVSTTRVRHSWLSELLTQRYQSYGFGIVTLTGRHDAWRVSRSKTDECVRARELLREDTIIKLLTESLPSAPPRSTAKEWLSAGLAAGLLALIIAAFRQTTNRRLRVLLALGVGVTAVVALALAHENNEIAASELSVIETTAGLPFGFATTQAVVTASTGGTLAVRTTDTQSTLMVPAYKDDGASEFRSAMSYVAQEESFALPAVAMAPRRPRQFVATSVIDLRGGITLKSHGNTRLSNQTPFRVIDSWSLGDGSRAARASSNSLDANIARWRSRLQSSLQSTWMKLPEAARSREQIVCALIALPPQMQVTPRAEKHEHVALLVVRASK